MFEKFLSIDAPNFRQRYLNTYGFFRHEDRKKILVRISSIDNVVRFVDKDSVDYVLNPDSANDVGFEFLPPKAGWHNTDSGGWLIRRTASRQWQRGICSANTRIETPMGHGCQVDFHSLSQIYEKTTTIQQALKRFNADRKYDSKHMAISPQFAVNSVTNQVFCFSQAVGSYTLDGEKFKVSLEDKDLWITEITDAFAQANLEMELQ